MFDEAILLQSCAQYQFKTMKEKSLVSPESGHTLELRQSQAFLGGSAHLQSMARCNRRSMAQIG